MYGPKNDPAARMMADFNKLRIAVSNSYLDSCFCLDYLTEQIDLANQEADSIDSKDEYVESLNHLRETINTVRSLNADYQHQTDMKIQETADTIMDAMTAADLPTSGGRFLRLKLSALEDQNKRLRDNITTLQDENINLQHEKEKLGNKLADFENKRAKLHNERKVFEEDVMIFEHEVTRLQNTISDLFMFRKGSRAYIHMAHAAR